MHLFLLYLIYVLISDIVNVLQTARKSVLALVLATMKSLTTYLYPCMYHCYVVQTNYDITSISAQQTVYPSQVQSVSAYHWHPGNVAETKQVLMDPSVPAYHWHTGNVAETKQVDMDPSVPAYHWHTGNVAETRETSDVLLGAGEESSMHLDPPSKCKFIYIMHVQAITILILIFP